MKNKITYETRCGKSNIHQKEQITSCTRGHSHLDLLSCIHCRKVVLNSATRLVDRKHISNRHKAFVCKALSRVAD